MAWQLGREHDLDELISFLRVAEWGHVAFSSRVYSSGKPDLPNPHRVSVYVNRSSAPVGEIHEALLVTQSGLVLPVLSDSGSRTARSDIGALIGEETRSLHSIMGVRRDVEVVQRSIAAETRAVLDYHLMVLPFDSPLNRAPGPVDGTELGLKFRRARPRDLIALFPLQREYEKEEVLLDPSRFNSAAAYLNLQQHIKHEIIYYAIADRQIVAKAGTNARGIEYDQLGGVYTVRHLRSMGVSTALVSVLIADLRRHQRNICLFVKKDNPAALRVYNKLGFERRDEFRIAYYSA